jgi:hypothetical protein
MKIAGSGSISQRRGSGSGSLPKSHWSATSVADPLHFGVDPDPDISFLLFTV